VDLEVAMRPLVSFVLVITGVVLPSSVGAHTGEEVTPKTALAMHMPAQLTLRASYFLYLDTDAIDSVASDQSGSDAREPKDASEGGEVASSESNPEQSASSSESRTAVPDIDTLSEKAIEDYEIQSAQRYVTDGGQGGAGRRSPGAKAGIAIGVILGVGLVSFGVAAAVIVATWEPF
jgi:hypothetical protein